MESRKIMKNYKMAVAYDGTRYKGWQSQKHTEETIQGKIENVLTKLAGHPVEVAGSGRTDAGVHALGQIANFHMEGNHSCEEILTYLNKYLPEDIGVQELKEVSSRFHSRLSAVAKTYRYRIHVGELKEIFERKYVYTHREYLNVTAMKEAASYLEGIHDFTSFSGNRHKKKSAIRNLYGIQIEEKGQEIRIYYRGDGFLHNMVRIMTGTLLEVGEGKQSPKEMLRILDAKDRGVAGKTAPSQGLALLEVEYENQ